MPAVMSPRPPRPRAQPPLGVFRPAGLRFFLTEELLEARRGSWMPTNGAGPDEDVNIYLALLLDRFAQGHHDARVVGGQAPLLTTPDLRLPRASRADWYRANADHRLLHLGLFHRGDGCRRRDVPWGWTAATARARDLAVAAACYEAAARLLAHGRRGGGALAEVLGKLATNCEDYVHVLNALALRRLGLGAHLRDADLAELVAERPGHVPDPVAGLLTAVPDDAMDVVLDLMIEYQRQPSPALRRRLEGLATAAGLDGGRLLKAAGAAT